MRRLDLLPAVVLTLLASHLAALGLQHVWQAGTGALPSLIPAEAAAFALHAFWVPAAVRVDRPLLVVCGWPAAVAGVCAGLVHAGFGGTALLYAVALETLLLAAARSAGPARPLADVLADARRSAVAVSTQVRMVSGLRPRARDVVHHVARDPVWEPATARRADRAGAQPVDGSACASGASAADAATLARLQELLATTAVDLETRAWRHAARTAADLEPAALAAAALCDEECARLRTLPSAERDAIASRCRAWVLGHTDHSIEVSTHSPDRKGAGVT
jgi:hypothetical protein